MKYPRASCPECGRIVSVRIPRGGDGSLYVTTRHKATKDSPAADCRGLIEATQEVTWP